MGTFKMALNWVVHVLIAIRLTQREAYIPTQLPEAVLPSAPKSVLPQLGNHRCPKGWVHPNCPAGMGNPLRGTAGRTKC